MENNTTKQYVLNTLAENSSPTMSHILEICNKHDMNITSVLLGKRIELRSVICLEEETKDTLQNMLNNWSLDKKQELKMFL